MLFIIIRTVASANLGTSANGGSEMNSRSVWDYQRTNNGGKCCRGITEMVKVHRGRVLRRWE